MIPSMTNDSATALERAARWHSLGMESKQGTFRTLSVDFNIIRDEFDILFKYQQNIS